MGKLNSDPLEKFYSRKVKDLNISGKIIKLLEESRRISSLS